jgi:hypothetical protein
LSSIWSQRANGCPEHQLATALAAELTVAARGVLADLYPEASRPGV